MPPRRRLCLVCGGQFALRAWSPKFGGPCIFVSRWSPPPPTQSTSANSTRGRLNPSGRQRARDGVGRLGGVGGWVASSGARERSICGRAHVCGVPGATTRYETLVRSMKWGMLGTSVVVLAGCGPATQSFPLEVSVDDAKASIGLLEACAKDAGHSPKVTANAVSVEPVAGQRVAFTLTGERFLMSTWVATDDDRGELPRLKALGDALWECAEGKPLPAPTSSASASASATPSPSAAPTSNPSASPAPAPSAAPSPEPAEPQPTPPEPTPSASAPAAPSSAPAAGGCEQDASCKRPPGAPCQQNDDCASAACSRGSCM